jgi:hypothetical protein
MSPGLRDRHFWVVIVAGAGLGILGVLLAVWGNPQNSGICVSCFIENSSGALGLHNNDRMAYLRPELIGFVLGSIACALVFCELRSRGGSAPLARLVSGVFLSWQCRFHRLSDQAFPQADCRRPDGRSWCRWSGRRGLGWFARAGQGCRSWPGCE